MRDERCAEFVAGGGIALCATGVDDEEALADMMRGGWRMESMLEGRRMRVLRNPDAHPSIAMADVMADHSSVSMSSEGGGCASSLLVSFPCLPGRRDPSVQPAAFPVRVPMSAHTRTSWTRV